jgi:methyl-accepting chemotaxis protein
MKNSIRSKKFIMGMVLFLAVILLISVSSVYYINKLSGKTSAILKENHYSAVYARDMSENLTKINQEITNCLYQNKYPDSVLISKQMKLFVNSLQLEKNNITETGEDKLATDIETGFNAYRSCVEDFMKTQNSVSKVTSLQTKFESLYQNLMLLSQINEDAIAEKTNAAKMFAKKASIEMSLIATICFIVAYGFSFSFGSYFNNRFFMLYDGIKEMAASKYQQRLSFEGNDEFHEISTIINEMAEKLTENSERTELFLQSTSQKSAFTTDIEELRNVLENMKNIEEKAVQLLSRLSGTKDLK